LFIQEKIEKEVKDLDISILVNNAGVGHNNLFVELSPREIQEIMNLNCVAAELLLNVFV